MLETRIQEVEAGQDLDDLDDPVGSNHQRQADDAGGDRRLSPFLPLRIARAGNHHHPTANEKEEGDESCKDHGEGNQWGKVLAEREFG